MLSAAGRWGLAAEEHACAQALRQAGVEYIVAPYEADAQMAWLALQGLVDAVITEDSDLLPYGCPRVRLRRCC